MKTRIYAAPAVKGLRVIIFAKKTKIPFLKILLFPETLTLVPPIMSIFISLNIIGLSRILTLILLITIFVIFNMF